MHLSRHAQALPGLSAHGRRRRVGRLPAAAGAAGAQLVWMQLGGGAAAVGGGIGGSMLPVEEAACWRREGQGAREAGLRPRCVAVSSQQRQQQTAQTERRRSWLCFFSPTRTSILPT